MAATQAEPQQNDVNRDSSHQDPSPVAVNTSFQNGTDNGNRRSVIGADVVASKGKKSVRNNVSVDMSQYRQESGPPTNNADQNVNSSEDSGGKLSNSDKSFSHNSEQSGSEVGYGKGGPEGQNMQGYGLGYPSRGGYMHPDGSQVPPGDGMGHHPGNSYGHFPPGMRHPGYPGAKPLPVPPGRPPSGGPPSGPGPGGYPGGPPGQRFALNPSISPPTGPTPTLNQLLQSSNSSHRSYQNSYGEYKPSGEGAQHQPQQQQQQSGGPPPPAGYGQSWPPGAGPPHPRPALSLSPISSGYQQQPSLYRPPSQTGGGPPGGPPTTGTGGGPGAGPGRGYGPPHQPQQQAGPPQQQAGPPQQPPQQQGSPSPHPPPGPGYPPSSPHHYPQQQQPSPYHQRQPQPIYQMVGGTGTPTANNGAPTGFAPSPGPGPGPHHQPVTGGQESGRPGGGPWSPGPNQGPQQGGPPPHQGPLSHQPPPSSPVSHLHQGYAGSTTQQSSGGPPGRSSEQSPSASTNTHHPEPPELSGQNSNDSSSGGGGPAGPGTPNSGSGLRPTPSPTGSTGSRSMSPAVGQQNVSMPPRPSSGQSESGNGPTRVSHSPMGSGSGPGGGGPGGGVTTPSGYPGPAPGGPGPQGGPPGAPPPHHLNYKMGPHPPPMGPHPHPHPHHHLSYSQQHPQYPQQGGYGSRGGSAMGMPYGGGGGQGYGGQGPPPGQYPPPRPIPNHVPQYPPYQHKVGYGGGMPPSPGSYNSGGGGGTMGPPSSHHPHPGMPPPPPPSSTGAPHEMPPGPGPPPGQPQPSSDSLSPVTSTPPGGLGGGGAGSVTSIVTTGPDGTALDEASQQSTLSNASAASGDDTVLTPSKQQQQQQRVKTEGVGGMLGYHGHPGTPGTVPSPGAASLNSDRYDDYPQDHSPPTWSRTPASPKSHDSLGKLYEMDETVERRLWLDKLLGFMEERGTPISACPTISKNPLDLYRLYHFVRERGGFMEVTKNKIWKDIAGSLGIGASSSAAYTLRKHYTKNLLPFECHFDRGGIDPQPIISQVEASSKKKAGKGVAPVPSPGSSNSQDSFQGAGSGNASMDGYSTYPGYPPQDYSSQQQRPPSQSSQGMTGGGGGYGGQGPGYPGQYPGGGEGYGGGYPTPGQYPPPGRPMYPPYVPPASQPDPDRGYNQSNSNSTSNNSSGGGSGGPVASGGSVSSSVPVTGGPPGGGGSGPGGGAPGGGQPGGEYPGRGYPGNSYPGGGRGYPGGAPSPGAATPPAPSQYPTGPDYYRPPEGYYPGPPGAAGPGGGPGKPMPPPAPQPRRHPDFVKDSSQPNYPAYSQPPRPNMYPGWSNSSSGGYPRGGGGYPPGPGGNSGGGGQQWGQAPPRPGAPSPVNHQGAPVQWQPSYQPPQASQGWGMSGGGVQPGGVRPQMGVAGSPRPGYRPNCPVPPHPGASVKGGPGGFGPGGGGLPTKRELVFPIESVEATTPVLYKRRRLNKVDVAPLEAWRVMMALKSGLLSEVTWALDVLNILLFDDTTIAYFGLLHLPGLMDILLEHMKRALSDMLEPSDDRCELDLRPEDLGAVSSSLPQPQEKSTFLKSADYTYRSRKGHPVTLGVNNNDIFVLDGKRSWDKDDIVEETEQDSRYIISCFKAELGKIPFYRMISGPKEKKNNDVEMEVEVKKEPADKEVEEKKPERKPPERAQKKKKSINDVLSRIKKETLGSDRQEEPPKPPDIKEEHQEEDKEPPAARPAEEMLEVIVKNDTDCEKLSCRIRDPAGTLKRRRISDYEDECYTRDEASLYLVNETQDGIARRCVCISTILRNLTFVPGNELEFAKSGTFLGLLGKLLLLHHEHPPRAAKQRNYDREEDTDFTDSCSSLQADSDWWWEFLHHLRENALVSIANIAGQTDLGLYPEDISRPILDGLLHWAVCPAAQGQDPFPTVSPTSSLSPQRLALEALCKLCVTDSNVDLVIATPPYCRLERLAAVLVRLLCRSEEQVLREFAVNLLYYLGAADSGMARTIALQPACISQLVAFIEQAEQSAVGIANQHGLSALRDNPDTMGTSLDMLRRAAKTLLHLSQHPENKVLFLQQEQRLLSLVMSQILDQQVASVISQVLYQVSRAESPGPSSGGADSKPPAVQQATSQPEQAPHEPALLTSTSTSSS